MTLKTYQGSCHCGAVRYEVQLDISELTACDCSLCGRTGWLLSFTKADLFELRSGKEQLRDYQFHKRVIHHPFCTICGVHSFSYGNNAEGEASYSINTRCLEGFNPEKHPIRTFPGKNI